ncbi:wd repeat protein [Moniliophthora roreri MCA 2997]|uniref:Wd repeat protein n=1 Tax=Moniliophthora roreri (strain MCA 2997) TaxID=1381753 RepID=V2WR83_MONRO|nr:wd repeat protein [Moniliophthora roreri MCA 2997]
MSDDNDTNEQHQEPQVRHVSLEQLLNLIAAAHSSSSSSEATRASAAAVMAELMMGSSSTTLPIFRGNDDDEDEVEEEGQEEDEEEWVDEDDGMDDDDRGYYGIRNSRQHKQWIPPHTSSQAAGIELLNSGDFGRVGPKMRARNDPPDVSLAKMIKSRLSKPYANLYREDLTSHLVPNSNGVINAIYDSNIYTAQYSKDSSFFYTCAQDFRLHVYDTLAPPNQMRPGRQALDSVDPHLRTTMKVSRRIQGQHGRWTITDANLSPDNQRIVYSSITSTAYMCSTTEDNPAQIPIPFADRRQMSPWNDWHGGSIALYSCRFSADGNEIIAGGRGQIFVYDLLANRRSVRIEAHEDDVNSCCWADTASGNVLVSASDDSFLKVWDRRSLGASQKPSGILVGHTEGITYVSAKGDGRYVLSNGKDQSMRLWDLRKMHGSEEVDTRDYGVRGFDYRYPGYPKPRYKAHPQDCSVMTYRGHQVLMTLIRCHFSPAETTGGQYLYSGSSDGRVHIWSLDGRVVQVLDRNKSLPISVDHTGPEFPSTMHDRGVCVRDVSWHSEQPVLISAAWEGTRSGSTLARHDWKGFSKMSGNLDDWNEKQRLESEERRNRDPWSSAGRLRSRMPGTFYAELDGDDEDDEDEDYQP